MFVVFHGPGVRIIESTKWLFSAKTVTLLWGTKKSWNCDLLRYDKTAVAFSQRNSVQKRLYLGYWPSVRSRSLDIGQVFFFCVFMNRDFVSVCKHEKKVAESFFRIPTSRFRRRSPKTQSRSPCSKISGNAIRRKCSDPLEWRFSSKYWWDHRP